MRVGVRWVLVVWMVLVCAAKAQTSGKSDDTFSRKIRWTLFAEYSPTSSHILMGASRQRKLADAGGALTLRVARFWGSDLSYQMELRPVLFESDPVAIVTTTSTLTFPPPIGTVTSTSVSVNPVVFPCEAGTAVYTSPPGEAPSSVSFATKCGRQWTFGQSFAPIGFKYALRTEHRWQPFVIGTLGYMYTSRPVPIPQAESLNFVWDFGAGVEVYRERGRSVSIEARLHHFSNRYTAPENPGVDNVMYKVSYGFDHWGALLGRSR